MSVELCGCLQLPVEKNDDFVGGYGDHCTLCLLELEEFRKQDAEMTHWESHWESCPELEQIMKDTNTFECDCCSQILPIARQQSVEDPINCISCVYAINTNFDERGVFKSEHPNNVTQINGIPIKDHSGKPVVLLLHNGVYWLQSTHGDQE